MRFSFLNLHAPEPTAPSSLVVHSASRDLRSFLQSMHLVCFRIQEQEKRNRFHDQLRALSGPDGGRVNAAVTDVLLDSVIMRECYEMRAAHEKTDFTVYNEFGKYKALVEGMLQEVTQADLRGEAAVATLRDLLQPGESCPCSKGYGT